MNIVLWNLKSGCTGSLFLLWQLPLRDFAVLTCRSRSVRKEINPWWVAEEGEMRSLVSGSDGALKPGGWGGVGSALHEHDGRSGVTWSPTRRLSAPTWRLITESPGSQWSCCLRDSRAAIQDGDKEFLSSEIKKRPFFNLKLHHYSVKSSSGALCLYKNKGLVINLCYLTDFKAALIQ